MRNRLIILAIFLLAAFIAWRTYQYKEITNSLPSRKFLIKNELGARLEVHAVRMRKRCEDQMLKEAKKNADSIVFIRANELMLFDSIQRPEKPIKPELPEKKELIDSLEITPLVKF